MLTSPPPKTALKAGLAALLLAAFLIGPTSAPPARSAQCRQLLIHYAGGPIQRAELNQPVDQVQHIDWAPMPEWPKGDKAIRVYYKKLNPQIVKPGWGLKEIKGVSLWCPESDKNCQMPPGTTDQILLIDLKAKYQGRPTKLSCKNYAPTGKPGLVLFNNFNNQPPQQRADNRPPEPTRFKLDATSRITEIITWHHKTFTPGDSRIVHLSGLNGVVDANNRGSWKFKAKPGLAEFGSGPDYYLPNCALVVRPRNLVLPPGEYQLNPAGRMHWTANAASGLAGMAIVWGEKVKDGGGGSVNPPIDPPPDDEVWDKCPGRDKAGVSFVLTWTHSGDSKPKGPDMDLRVETPSGKTIKGSPDDEGGYTDGTGGETGWGSGPECVHLALKDIQAGTYKAFARYGTGNGYAQCRLAVYINGKQSSSMDVTLDPKHNKSAPLEVEPEGLIKMGQSGRPLQTIRYKKGTYLGQVKNGRPQGRGTLTFDNGNRYVGQFDNARPSGGKFYWANGAHSEKSYISKEGKWINKGITKPPTRSGQQGGAARGKPKNNVNVKGDLTFILTWNHSGDKKANGPDIDIWVKDPQGNFLSSAKRKYFGPTKQGGRVDKDDEGGYAEKGDEGSGGGPERVFWPSGKAPAGVYEFGCNLAEGNGTAHCRLEVYYRGKRVANTTEIIRPGKKDSRTFKIKIQ